MLRAATVNFYYCPIVPSSCHRLWADIQGVNQCCLDVILRHFGSRWSKTPFKEKGTGPINTDSCISSLFHVQSPYMEVLLSWCDDSGCFTVSGGSGCTVHSHGAVQCMDCVHLGVVRCQPCHCRRVWHETCSSVCKLWQVSSDHIWAKEQNERSSESKRSEKTVHTSSATIYMDNLWVFTL